jgi:large subunit ribosomal protein L25
MLALEVKARADADSSEALRAEGIIPAVLYGPKEGSASIAIDARKLESVWRDAGETTVITLKGMGADMDTLIHDVQLHPVTGKILHADFYVLEKGKKIEISVPIEFVGEAPAEKLGHILVKALHEVEIEVAPAELPQHLEVDISGLTEVGDHIVARDIKLPPSATLKTDPEEIIASVTAFHEDTPQEIPTEAAPATEVSTEPAGEEK